MFWTPEHDGQRAQHGVAPDEAGALGDVVPEPGRPRRPGPGGPEAAARSGPGSRPRPGRRPRAGQGRRPGRRRPAGRPGAGRRRCWPPARPRTAGCWPGSGRRGPPRPAAATGPRCRTGSRRCPRSTATAYSMGRVARSAATARARPPSSTVRTRLTRTIDWRRSSRSARAPATGGQQPREPGGDGDPGDQQRRPGELHCQQGQGDPEDAVGQVGEAGGDHGLGGSSDPATCDGL